MDTVAVAYIPVLHKGYLDFLRAANPSAVYLVGEEVLQELPDTDYLIRKDSIRALTPNEIQKNLESLDFGSVEVATVEVLTRLSNNKISVVMPDEDVSRSLKEAFLKNIDVTFAPVFLRWHRDNVKEDREVAVDKKVSVDSFDKEIMGMLHRETEKSFDWWRQVGAAAVRDGKVLLVGHNKHLPHEQAPNVFGDPRSVSKKGIDFHITTSLHAELALIGEAGRRGISLAGASLYVTDFPCPFCARAIAHAGISKCFFKKGYANLDGDTLLRSYGVELIRVD